jgi:hypothetical protein
MQLDTVQTSLVGVRLFLSTGVVAASSAASADGDDDEDCARVQRRAVITNNPPLYDVLMIRHSSHRVVRCWRREASAHYARTQTRLRQCHHKIHHIPG